MRKLITVFIFLFSISMCPHIHGNMANAVLEIKESNISLKDLDTSPKPVKIKSRTFTNLKGATNGFYVVANVFKNKGNLKGFIKTLKQSKINADFVYNPNNDLNYLYLQRYDSWQAALDACQSNFYGLYQNKLWIMIIDNKDTVVKQPKPIKKDSKEKTAVVPITKKKKKNPQNKLIQKADEYFNKMRYAEAAELYEQALKDNEENYSFEILQKAGDAHYFNTNMEKAYHWYNILYENYKDTMSADNLFKYAHTLKGTGKYARSKRLMRLYNKKLKSGGNYYAKAPSKEMALDNILNSEDKYDIKNAAINSVYSDFAPMYHNENELVYSSAKDTSVYTTLRYKWNNQPYLDLYVAKLNEESQELRSAMKFSKKINTKYHEASVTFSPDNTTMYFTRNNYKKKLKRDNKGINNLKIYMSKKRNGEWTEAVEVSFNSDQYSTGHPALSPDGKKLYFVSDMPGSIGKTDIFVVDVLEDGLFSEPKNLGPEINTEQREMFPFVSNEKLYFSSNGHVGLGGLDVFEADISEEEGFENLKNMGAPINSRRDDFSYIINEKTQKGFFASNRKGGKGDDDIYSFTRLIPEELNENAIAGVVTELITGEVMRKALVTLLDENNIKLKEMETEHDGSFIFDDLEGNTKYTLKTVKQGYMDKDALVSTKENEVVNVDMPLRRLKEMITIEDGIKKLKTDMIYFDFDKFHIRDDAAKELDKLVEVMNEHKNMVIKIESHTDAIGNREYNKYLSDKRAKSSRDYLISKGIDANRIESAIGYGEERLLNECGNGVRCSREKHALNRRSEFIIVKM